MKIKITADSTCDLSEELLKKWDIALMPMHILMGEDSYLDGVTVHPADVFAYVNNGGKMPKSARPPIWWNIRNSLPRLPKSTML